MLVIDANIAIAWFRPDPTKLADAALDAICSETAIVPSLWRWEVQDVLRRLSVGGHLKMSLRDAIAELRQLPIEIDDGSSIGLFGDELALSERYGLSVYDAAYLEICIRHRIPLATIDKSLASAAKKVGLLFSAT